MKFRSQFRSEKNPLRKFVVDLLFFQLEIVYFLTEYDEKHYLTAPQARFFRYDGLIRVRNGCFMTVRANSPTGMFEKSLKKSRCNFVVNFVVKTNYFEISQ